MMLAFENPLWEDCGMLVSIRGVALHPFPLDSGSSLPGMSPQRTNAGAAWATQGGTELRNPVGAALSQQGRLASGSCSDTCQPF